MADEPAKTSVLELLEKMTEESIKASSLEAQTLMLVRLAALVAVDAPPACYLMNLGVTCGVGLDEVGLDEQRVQDVLDAVAPIVGTARIASAQDKLFSALGGGTENAELEE